jgi:hypothetical protein
MFPGLNGFLTLSLCGFCYIPDYRGTEMDLLMILGTIVFFVVAIAYTIACDKLK